MGKFMQKKRTADVAVMEGCLGVRTRAKTFSVEKQHPCIVRKALFDQQQASTDSSPIEARLKNRKDGDAGEPTDATVTAMNEEAENCMTDMEEASAEQPLNDPRSLEEGASEQNSLQQEQEATTTSNASSCVQEEGVDGDEDEVVAGTSSNLRLRESHSDSCLRRERGPIAVAHSRSNSASFTQEQASSFVAGLGTEKQQVLEPRADIQRVEENRQEVSTKEIEASYGDNTVVLSASAKERPERQTSSYVCQALSITNDERGEEQPGSSSRRHYNHPTDCGPGWRHRMASSAPTADEIEEFFAGVEQEKDDRKRFVDKYNFDIFNEAPLPGRFEWVRFNS